MSNLFLDAKQLMLQNDGLNHLNYQSLNQEQKEFLTSQLWEFEWTKPCNAVYFPGNAFVRARTTGVTPALPGGMTQMEATIRNFKIIQQASNMESHGTISITYMDFEDQAISAWLWDWREKLGDTQYRYIFRKEDTSAEGRLTIYNSSRKPIRVYNLYGIQLQDPGTSAIFAPALTSEAPQNIGEITAQFSFEHYELAWKNI